MRRSTGFDDCIDTGLLGKRGRRVATARDLSSRRGFAVIGSSDKVHEVDALAITGDEGRGSLR